MKALYSSLFVAAAIIGAAPAFGQTPAAAPAGPVCEIEQGKPQAVARAMLSLTRANAAAKGGNPTSDLKDVIASLNAPNFKNENPVGRAFMLASAYVLFLEQPGVQAVSPRSAVGLTTDPNGSIDLFAAADSAIKVVEASSPSCAEYMAPFRRQKAWIDVTNGAISALNANKLDSAEIYARRSLTLDPKSPYAYTVLASVARNRKDMPKMIEYSRQVIATSGNDTAYTDVKERAQYDLAMSLTDRAKAATGPDRKTFAREAIAAWTPLIESKDIVQGSVAISNLSAMYVAAGDSLQLAKVYAPLLVNPANFSEGALLQAGVIASQIKRPAEAARLFEASASRNPYSRDALNNIAASYLQADQPEKALPYIDKLVSLDPANPENYMLYAFTYVGKLKKKSDTKTTKLYNDSLVYWNNKAEKMPVKVTFTEFSRNNEGTTLVGAVENRGTAAKTYTLNFEFLGPKGEVIFTDTQTVGPVAPKATKEFRIKNAKQGVAGYRYKPIV